MEKENEINKEIDKVIKGNTESYIDVLVNRDRRNELTTKEWFEMNAKLQKKKGIARKALVEMGVLEKKGENKYDNYKYFTEAQYKDVANEILVKANIEIKADLVEMERFTFNNVKTPVGRIAKMRYSLIDTETGFYEETLIEGEGLDRGDKAGYKAYTGAVKYFLANTFLVPTGDDPETESPGVVEDTKKQNTIKKTNENVKLVSQEKIDKIKLMYQGETKINKLLSIAKVDKLENLTEKMADYFISVAMKEKTKEETSTQNEQTNG